MEKEGEEEIDYEEIASASPSEKVGQEQIHGLLFEEKLSWQAIIYDLIRSGQLDPWDIDITLLAERFLEKVRQLEEANFFISSQVLLAAAFILRLKSDIVLNQYIPNLDAVLFNKKTDEKKYSQERIEIEGEIPGLVLRTPLPRFKKVTLEELMKALGNAIKTENRRIRKVVLARQQEFETAAILPRNPINLKERIGGIYARLRDIFSEREEKVAFSEFAGNTKDEKVATFVPLLHLDNQHKIWLEQEAHLAEIWILLKSVYEKKNAEILAVMKKEAEEAIGKLTDEEKERAEKIEKDFENPVSEQTRSL